jgi:Fe2+ or Zn2+ uptake regulation protein
LVVQRNTWQRERVREALADARGFVSAQSLHATLRDENTGIGLATVYRALAGLAATIRPLVAGGVHVYAYFKHEDEPTAPRYAQQLLELLG